MSKVSGSVPFVAAVDRSSRVPLHRQLYDGLRGAILSGRLAAGTRLPSTRELAAGLGVSRNTVMGAFLPLLAEGYLEGRVGSGTYVAKSLPENLLRPASGYDKDSGVWVQAVRYLSGDVSWLRRRPRTPGISGRRGLSGQRFRRSRSFPGRYGGGWRAGRGGVRRGVCSGTETRPGTGR